MDSKGNDLSKEQEWAVPFKKIKENKSPDNWGIENLAIEPGNIIKTRKIRSTCFDELPPNASTMFERLESRLEQHVGSNDLLPAFWLEEGAACSKSVCKIDASGIDYEGKSGSWHGTGFLVAPNILCTNHHVINSVNVAERSRALFDFSALSGGGIRPVSTFRLRPDLLFWTSSVVATGGSGGLDVTFVAVDGDPGATYGHISLLRQSFVVAEHDKLNIIQHPDGRLKEVALRNNKVVWQDGTIVHYQSDTEPGSSGAPVFSDGWELLALHHASAKTAAGEAANEGIKFSAIASAIEQDAQRGDKGARQLLSFFRGTDELMGFFGSLGRAVSNTAGGMERVVDTYSGEDQDIDIGFWNIEWFNKRWRDKLDAVARIIIEMNLDIWIFSESSEEATNALAQHLSSAYDSSNWGVLASQDAPSTSQITTVMWNTKTLESVSKRDWPETVQRWFNVDSRAFDDLGLEAVHGKVFDRFPALYEIKTKIEGNAEKFNLVPVHLKAKDEGSLRRRMASRLLAEAISEVSKIDTFDGDWIIGGDYNASLDSGDFDSLIDSGLQPLSAHDAATQQITYIKSPYKSLIDHIFVSPNMVSDDNFIIVALDRSIDRFLDVSDHRPILMRLAGQSNTPADREAGQPQLTDDDIRRLMRGFHTRGHIGRVSGYEDAVQRLRDRTIYYDDVADGIIRANYWHVVNPATSDLTRTLSALLEQTHTNPLNYEPSKHVYPWVDLRPNGKIKSIYSDFEATPEYFIQADLEVDRLRTEARTALNGGGFLESAQLESMLESQFKYNCEHVVPQSWYSKREPMRGDLHHLFSCEPRCNSFRSNFPLVQHELERTMQDCGRVEDDLFEPKGGKGAVARATLYFMLRYPGVTGHRYSGQRLETLLRWHRQYKPDEWELHRNAAIFILQGNRNPLVDFPDWVDQIKFQVLA